MIYRTRDAAAKLRCSRRTLQYWALRLFGPLTEGHDRFYTEEQLAQIRPKLQHRPGNPTWRRAGIVALLLLAVLAGCTMSEPPYDWLALGDQIPEELPYLKAHTVCGIVEWVRAWVIYRTDESQYGTEDYWATPNQTYASKQGDCEDHALLALYLIWRDLGIEGDLVVGYHYRMDVPHAWIDVPGYVLDPTVTLYVPRWYIPINRIDAEEALRRCNKQAYAKDAQSLPLDSPAYPGL